MGSTTKGTAMTIEELAATILEQQRDRIARQFHGARLAKHRAEQKEPTP